MKIVLILLTILLSSFYTTSDFSNGDTRLSSKVSNSYINSFSESLNKVDTSKELKLLPFYYIDSITSSYDSKGLTELISKSPKSNKVLLTSFYPRPPPHSQV